MTVGRRQFIATLAAALVAPRLPLPAPAEPLITPLFNGTLPPATGVLTFEMLQKCIDDILKRSMEPQLVLFPPWYVEQIARIERAEYINHILAIEPDRRRELLEGSWDTGGEP